MQTILGSGGCIANNTAASLRRFTNEIRLVSRNPKALVGDEQLIKADLTNPLDVDRAVAGSEIVYLLAGLTYKTSIWQEMWPRVMNAVVESCLKNNSKLVFFDNVYALGLVNGWMTEETPINPISKKGEVRAQILNIIDKATKENGLKALIARSPDFYGPATLNSFTNFVVFDRLKKGKQAQWFINPTLPHHMIYTPDAGKATAILGNTPDAYNQIWNLPTDSQPISGKEFIEKAAIYFKAKPGIQVAPRWMIKLMGTFVPVMKENVEMLYQMEFPYLFSSAKFANQFPDFKITTYDEGIRNTAEFYLNS